MTFVPGTGMIQRNVIAERRLGLRRQSRTQERVA
jgi:hypothetical protein